MVMPRAKHEALEQRRNERWARDQDPYVDTDKDEEEVPNAAAVNANAMGEVRQRTIATLARLISISQGTATAHYNDQNIVRLHSL